MRGLVVAALWVSLMVAAGGVWLLAGLGWALIGGGVSTAAVLFFLVDADGRAEPVEPGRRGHGPEPARLRPTALRQVGGL